MDTGSGNTLRADVVVFGGGVAGLWTLDALRRAGYSCALLEPDALGAGQTIWSQGIIHGGAKYTLRGLSDRLAHVTKVIADMPGVWADALAGRGGPDLKEVRLRAPCCHLWRTSGVASWAGIRAAAQVLKTPVVELSREERPAALSEVPGEVYRLEEQVIDCESLLAAFHKLHGDLCFVMPPRLKAIVAGRTFELVREQSAATFCIEAQAVVICGGNGNGWLRERFALDPTRQQVRPLRMALVRGEALPELYGHCVDGAMTRVTITSARDRAGRTVWQVGGQLAEDAVNLDPETHRARLLAELAATVPGFRPNGLEVAFYQANRAEQATDKGFRPDDASVLVEGPVVTVWPTKLALAPRAAEIVLGALEGVSKNPRLINPTDGFSPVGTCPPPWETAQWIRA